MKTNRKIVIHFYYDKSEVVVLRQILFFWIPVKSIVFYGDSPVIRQYIASEIADELADRYKITCNHFIKYH